MPELTAYVRDANTGPGPHDPHPVQQDASAQHPLRQASKYVGAGCATHRTTGAVLMYARSASQSLVRRQFCRSTIDGASGHGHARIDWPGTSSVGTTSM